MKVLVTGGAGFQGAALARALHSRGDEVTVLTPSGKTEIPLLKSEGIKIVEGRVGDYISHSWIDILKGYGSNDAIAHLGAITNPDESLSNPVGTYQTNIIGTAIICRVARATGCRLIYASSCEAYGPANFNHLQTEKSPFNPPTPYAASKAAADAIVRAEAHCYGTRAIVLRPCNIYGPKQKIGIYGAVIANWCFSAAKGEPIEIYGTGKQTREWLYISDLVAAYLKVIDSLEEGNFGGAFNVTCNATHSLSWIADLIREKTGTPVIVRSNKERSGDVKSFNLDGQKFVDTFGWSAKIPFEVGIDRTLDYYKSKITTPISTVHAL